jgi:hypothetical protein
MSKQTVKYTHYRDFVSRLSAAPEQRVIDDKAIADSRDCFLVLASGAAGGVAIVVREMGSRPTDGFAIRIAPTTTRGSLAAALSSDRMLSLAKSILTPGSEDLIAAAEFAAGLKRLEMKPFETDETVPTKKPPALAQAIWDQIQPSQRREYIREMARALRRGDHPDDTVTRLLATV